MKVNWYPRSANYVSLCSTKSQTISWAPSLQRSRIRSLLDKEGEGYTECSKPTCLAP